VSAGEETGAPSSASPRPRSRSHRGPSPVVVFAAAFVLLLAAAACVAVGNFRPNETLLPMLSFYLSGAAVVLTVVALVLPGRRRAAEGTPEP
jgi:hypothetical protein